MKLNKLFLMGAVATLLSQSAFAADEDKISIGLEVAPTFSWLSVPSEIDNVEGDGGHIKFDAGLNVFYNFGTDNRYSFVSGIHYNGMGGYLKGSGSYLNAEGVAINAKERVKYNFQEFEIPAGIRLRTGSFDKFRFDAILGIGLGILTSGQASCSSNGNDYEGKTYGYGKMPLRGLYNLGLGAEYDLGSIVLTGRINYKGSITPIYFYDDDLTDASRYLDLDETNAVKYADKIKFRPSNLEFAIGCIF